MDLGAFVQIEDLDELARINGIEIPRLRGYRLMSQCEPYTAEETETEIKEIKDSYRSMHERLSRLYGVAERVRIQHELWNKYAGRSDVLYIHSRIGYDYLDFEKKSWFLDGTTDAFDGTYCDIYAKIEKFPEGGIKNVDGEN